MKLPEATKKNEADPWRNALVAAEDVPRNDGKDGSRRLLLYCRCAKRHGFDKESVITIVREMIKRYPLPKEYTDSQIVKRWTAADVEVGEAYKEDEPQTDTPPWETPEAKPERDGDTEPPIQEDGSQLVSGESILATSMVRIVNREAEVVFDCGKDLEDFEVGPGKVTIVGAPPGTGKTSLASQVGFAVLGNHDVPLVIANAEMDSGVLVRRELARSAQVGYQKVRFAKFDDVEEGRLFDAARCLKPLMQRTSFMQPPYTSEKLILALGDVPGLLIVDYLQKFRSGTEALEGLEVVMGHLRYIALAGWAVLALSSTARQQGKGGKHDHSQLDMGSFRGSGEIEFQADAAYVLRDMSGGAEGDRVTKLDCLKNRHGPTKSMDLMFMVDHMRFEREGPAPDTSLNDWNDRRDSNDEGF